MNRNITALILIVVGAGLYFTVTRTMIADVKLVKADNDAIAQAIQNAEDLKSKREEVTNQYTKISAADRANLDKMIPSAVDNIRLIIDLNNRALAHGFSLGNIKATVPANTQAGFARPGGAPVPTVQGQTSGPIGQLPNITVNQPALDKVTISFNATASYDQFQAFLRDLESDLRIIDLTHITVTSSDSGQYAYDIQMQTYWLRQ